MTTPASPGTRHTKPQVARTWVDFTIPSNGFSTCVTSGGGGRAWRAEIGKGNSWIASDLHPTEDAAKTHAVALANKKWPCT